ncbi:P4a precursor [Choristoneura rosaceana entomopoxvirus 'L']|uniref:P4a n=1 Tax=Choristoneura rosaceana entomopoxvirus 'L' TaxID=1293539 RepID=A0ABM9QKJ9_9POXV|nr:P4a precursor [Choristoneura rosaceana entomopoxvirus 'L']CCU56059.1 P4a precursor [Choristoneura rosaceana entomopoxvirus 'L']
MRNNKEKYMNHFTDFIIRNLPFRNLIDTMKDNIIINNEQYKIDELFKYIYYHPLDLITISDISNADRKDEYVKQFINNLYMRYSYNEMDFIKNNIKYDDKIYSNITEINYFPDFTSDFLKYRLSHYESESSIRGGRVVTFSGIPDNGYGYILSQSDPASEYIWKIVDNYLMNDNEDKYDFYIQYIPFIEYFLHLYYKNIAPQTENNQDQINANHFVKKLNYFNTSQSRYNDIDKEQKFKKYLYDNTIDDIESIDNYNNIIEQIFETIFLYNIMDMDTNAMLDTIITDSNHMLINKFYSKYLPNPDDLYILWASYNMTKIINDKTITNILYINSLIGILLYVLISFDDSEMKPSIDLIKTYYSNNLFNYTTPDINPIREIKTNIEGMYNSITADQTVQAQYDALNGDANSHIEVKNVMKPNSKLNYDFVVFEIENADTKMLDIERASLDTKFKLYLERTIRLIDMIIAIYNIGNPLQHSPQRENIKYVNVTALNYNIMKQHYIKTFKNTNIDIKNIINNNLNIIKNYKNNNLYDSDKIKLNYKSFISLLPTIYYIIFYNQPMVEKDIYRRAIVQQPGEEPIPQPPTRTKRVRFNPFNVEEAIITPDPQPVFNITKKNYLYDTLFWSGISIDDYNNFPLYIKTIIMDSCLILGIQINDDNSRNCVIYDPIEYNGSITKICIVPYPYTSNRSMYDIFKQVSDRIRNVYNIQPNYYINNFEKHIGLSTTGNNTFINKLSDCDDIKDLINIYVLLRELNPGTDDLKLPTSQHMYLAITLLDLMGFSPVLTRRNTSVGTSYYIQTDRQVNSSNLLSLMSKDYKYINKSKDASDVIVNILSPLLGYLRFVLNYNRTNISTLNAGSNNSMHECCIPIISNPLDQLRNIDISFTESDNILDIMNKDMFNLDNDIFKHIMINNMYGGTNTDIVDIIYDNIPQSIYMKTDIVDKIYDKMFAGAYSINDILEMTYNDDGEDINNYDTNVTKDLIRKLRKLLNRSNLTNLEDNANIVKSQILSSINNVFNRYSCSERTPIQYLVNIRSLLKQYSNENIEVTPELKEDIRNTITGIYKNTKKIIKIITVLSAGIDLVRAYKRSNIDVTDTVIDENFIKRLCELCKDSFYKYNRNNDVVYKNLLKDVFSDVEINDYDLDDPINEVC